VIQFESNGVDQLIVRLQAMKDRMTDLSVPLTQSGIAVRDSAVTRFKQEGGDQNWVASKRGGHTGILTGRLMNSISVNLVGSTQVEVGSNLPYAAWFQHGTGLFAGHSAWKIVAKNGKALAFTIGGVTYLRKSVVDPGQVARPFLVLGDGEKARIERIFNQWFDIGQAA